MLMKRMHVLLTSLMVVISALTLTLGFHIGQASMDETIKKLKSNNTSLSNEISRQYDVIERYEDVVTQLKQTVKEKEDMLATPVTLSVDSIPFDKDTKVAKFTISAYSPYDDQNYINSDGNPNKTATGTKPGPGTFAVDPSVIPYGSRVTIMYPDGTMERGIAEDTGGAIKNNRIDVFRYTYSGALDFGMKQAIVLWEGK